MFRELWIHGFTSLAVNKQNLVKYEQAFWKQILFTIKKVHLKEFKIVYQVSRTINNKCIKQTNTLEFNGV